MKARMHFKYIALVHIFLSVIVTVIICCFVSCGTTNMTTYRNGYIVDAKGKVVSYYANGYIFDNERKVKGNYSNGYVYDENKEIIATYANGYIKSAKHRENGWYRIIDGQKDSIASRPIVTVKEFASLRLDNDFFGKAVITGSVSKHILQAWADSTEQLIGKRIGFVFNDSVITVPRINMRLESGNFQISNPHNYDMLSLYKSLLKEKKDSLDALFEANGWENDTLFFNRLSQEKQDSIINTLDYIDACSIVKGFENK